MIFHIPWLRDVIVLSALVFPGSLSQVIPAPKRPTYRSFQLRQVAVYVPLILLAATVLGRRLLFVRSAQLGWYLGALLAGLLCIALEFLVGALLLWAKDGRFPKGFAVHPSYTPGANVVEILLVAFLVLGEELILRQAFFAILLGGLGLAPWAAIALSALIYGLNHIFFGWSAVPQKVASGALYASLYYLAGMSILVPVIAHLVQNMALIAFALKGREYHGKATA